MKRDFIELLACPECGSPLDISGDGNVREVETGELLCKNGHRFSIVGGIPRFVDSELYAQNFGFEWNQHPTTQLDGPGSDESEREFRAKTGFKPEDLRGKRVLDVGCGMGRFAEVASRWGGTVVGIDLSRAIEAAERNMGSRTNVHFAQANIFELPFRDGTFDYIYSVGVLHHTPNTKRAFDNLPRLLRANGRIAIWVYSRYSTMQWRFSDLYRRVTPRLPKRLLHVLSYSAVPLYYAYKIPIVGFLLQWFLPVSNHPDPDWRILNTFDWYSPTYQWKHTYEEVFPWFEAQGLKDVRVLGFPISVQGTKPNSSADSAGTPETASETFARDAFTSTP